MGNIFNNLFEQLDNRASMLPVQEQFIGLLHRTWNRISIEFCRSVLEKKHRTVEEDNIARVELTPDEVRCAVYCNIQSSRPEDRNIVEEWFDLTPEQQNQLLIEAFPGDQVYGV